MPRAPIFTIGHANRTWEDFVETLKKYDVGFVVDVRTTPHSSYSPQFNKENLAQLLLVAELKYLYLGEDLGARRTEPHLLSDIGKVSYAKVRQTTGFKAAIGRIESGASAGHRLALLCAEGDPLECHRFPMIAYQLAIDGFDVRHILLDGTIKTHAEVEQDLLKQYAKKIPQPSLFGPDITEEDQLEAAYDLLNLDIGWEPK